MEADAAPAADGKDREEPDATPPAEDQQAQAAALAQWWPAYLASVQQQLQPVMHAAAAAAAAAAIGSPHTSRRRLHDKRERSDSPLQQQEQQDAAAAASSSHAAAASSSNAVAADSSPLPKRSRKDLPLHAPLLASPAWFATSRLIQSPLSSPNTLPRYLNGPVMMPLPAIALPLDQLATAASDPSSAAAMLAPRGFLTAPANSVTGEIPGLRELGIPVSATAAHMDGIATIRNKRVRDYRCNQPAVGADLSSDNPPRCAYEASSDRDRFEHLATHHNRFECFSCDLECGSREAWSMHLQVHTGSQPAACDFCGRGFKDAKQAKRHSPIHDGVKSFVCPTCGHSFSKSSNLTTHLKIHAEGPKEFACGFEGCGKSFVQKAVRDAHERTHTKEKPFLCDICDASFTQKSSLVIHQRCHTGDRPFACQFCEKRFPSTSNLIVHQRVHTGEKAYVCTIPGCARGFTRKQQLEKHVMSEHIRKQQQPQMQPQPSFQVEQKEQPPQQMAPFQHSQQPSRSFLAQQQAPFDDTFPAGESLGLPAVLDAAAAASAANITSAQQAPQQQSDLNTHQMQPLGSPMANYRSMYAPIGSPQLSPSHRDLRHALASPIQRRPSTQAFSFLQPDMQPQNNEQNQNDSEQQ